MAGTILLVDDRRDEVVPLMEALRPDFEVHFREDPRDVLQERFRPLLARSDAMVIDVHMPPMSGFALWNRISRGSGYDGLLFFLSADATEPTVRRSLTGTGADHLDKSIPAEITALRIRNAIGRAAPERSAMLALDGLGFDERSQAFALDGNPLDLTRIESRILSYLLVRPGHAAPRTAFAEHVWLNRVVSDQTVRSHLSNLNRKLSAWKHRAGIDRNGVVLLETRDIGEP